MSCKDKIRRLLKLLPMPGSEVKDESKKPTPYDLLNVSQRDIPHEMNVFWVDEASLLPPGKTFSDLTPQEKKDLKNMYRFMPLRPGIYQGITGRTNRYNNRGDMLNNT